MKVEVRRFEDGRMMVTVVFEQTSNFWVDSEISWVPTIEEVNLISDTLVAIDKANPGRVHERRQSK